METWLSGFGKRQSDRFAALNARLDDRRHDVEARMREGFAAINWRIDDVVPRLSGLDTQLLGAGAG